MPQNLEPIRFDAPPAVLPVAHAVASDWTAALPVLMGRNIMLRASS